MNRSENNSLWKYSPKTPRPSPALIQHGQRRVATIDNIHSINNNDVCHQDTSSHAPTMRRTLSDSDVANESCRCISPIHFKDNQKLNESASTSGHQNKECHDSLEYVNRKHTSDENNSFNPQSYHINKHGAEREHQTSTDLQIVKVHSKSLKDDEKLDLNREDSFSCDHLDSSFQHCSGCSLQKQSQLRKECSPSEALIQRQAKNTTGEILCEQRLFERNQIINHSNITTEIAEEQTNPAIQSQIDNSVDSSRRFSKISLSDSETLVDEILSLIDKKSTEKF